MNPGGSARVPVEGFVNNMIWKIAQPDPPQVRELARALNISGILAALLLNRGLHATEPARKFLDPQFSHLHDPFLMCDLELAVNRIREAIHRRQKILIYGDYDVDGSTAVVILKKALEMLGAECTYHIPERLVEGYGMKIPVLEKAAREGVQLVITVDTGIKAYEAVERARALDLDCVITDHHLPENGLPKALAVVNPKRSDCPYPDKHLCGVGIAFKLVQALFMKTGNEKHLPAFLKVVAIGTIADVVPLIGENRVFAKLGLEGLQSPANPGLRSLIETAGLEGRSITSTDIGFRLAPRINAVGRMGGSREAVELFAARDEGEARRLAGEMNRLNRERQVIEEQILRAIERRIASDPDLVDSPIKVIDGDDWHIGVLGIVASKIAERFQSPTLIISRIDRVGSGSGRAPEGFHLLQALESCRDLLDRFGGHAQAAGFQLQASKVSELRRRINRYAASAGDFKPGERQLDVDAEVRLSDLDDMAYRQIQRLSPFGKENPAPLFVARQLTLIAEPRILKGRHLKFRVEQDGRAMDALAWNMADRLPSIRESGGVVSLAFEVSENLYPGFRALQLVVRDIRAG